MKLQVIVNTALGSLIVAMTAWLLWELRSEFIMTGYLTTGRRLPTPTTIFVVNSPYWMGVLVFLEAAALLVVLKAPGWASTVWLIVAVVAFAIMSSSAVGAMEVFMPGLAYKL